MPRRDDLKTILLLGAGPIVIGQACEFDYSGVQACRALRAEGYRVILVNSNPATIMTDPDTADVVYIEPVEWESVSRVIARERPDALLPTMGGQTALNCALELGRRGVLAQYGVALIGASVAAIEKAEDRGLFAQAMAKIGLEMPRAVFCTDVAAALRAAEVVGFPAIVRPSFTLGGTGGGIARDAAQLAAIAARGLAASPIGQILVEQSVLGWKEFEMEVVRDRADNCIIVCAIENLDPMGVHTGDSITVAPALTLTDREYQRMRDASFAVIREVGVDTGGANVQFAVDPASGRMVVIEMNPRVSRSSALASKATGFPIAKVAARLAVGYTLDELDNEITRVTPASFEPAIDYVVVKLPRFAFEKFKGAETRLGTQMKSVGEVMAIGRSFQEALQKALCGLESGICGLESPRPALAEEALCEALSHAGPDRLLYLAEALRRGFTPERVQALTRVDPWFVDQIAELVATEEELRGAEIGALDAATLRALKRMGFADRRIAQLIGAGEAELRARREALGVTPVFLRVDTCAAEFASETPYLYSSYEEACEARPTGRDKVMILGAGPNRIGQGIEFDYCCVHAALALRAAGFETIMVNCNPETVSTDYDTADRLYFEPLTLEAVLAIVAVERPLGVIVQLGGQTPLKLARGLAAAGVRILGTSPDAIDLAEDRARFKGLLQRLGLRQPENATAMTLAEAVIKGKELGFPLVVRPSYVLGGRAMEIARSEAELERFLVEAFAVAEEQPVLLDRYLRRAIEVDVDALADGVDVIVAGVMEHIEHAGVHSGDSACALPPHSLSAALQAELRRQTVALARALGVVGLMNVQFAVVGDDIYVLEVNPRAARTVPFVAKATGLPLAGLAARVIAGASLRSLGLTEAPTPGMTSVKEAVLPFHKFPGADSLLGPEMKSTGETMGSGVSFAEAYAKALLGAGVRLPLGGAVALACDEEDAGLLVPVAARLRALGFAVSAVAGTCAALRGLGAEVVAIDPAAGLGGVTLALAAGRAASGLRGAALAARIPCYTTIAGLAAGALAIERMGEGPLMPRSLREVQVPITAAPGASPTASEAIACEVAKRRGRLRGGITAARGASPTACN
ncbi:carbamoyl-phosphate synthase large subunit [Nannocystis sp.]|uniref:carbamoyl-phosphate synthase large subunit n=1 Tax=Nannocystis sp. TaxID=1962667 RepID=UPI0025DA1415|nr:carbamoyl-phosphate synthase large subunit [Nannocystis sp.]MBK7829697.1 carbamoyl-phosphate synthase large subunit [Nannocystis sp.]